MNGERISFQCGLILNYYEFWFLTIDSSSFRVSRVIKEPHASRDAFRGAM